MDTLFTSEGHPDTFPIRRLSDSEILIATPEKNADSRRTRCASQPIFNTPFSDLFMDTDILQPDTLGPAAENPLVTARNRVEKSSSMDNMILTSPPGRRSKYQSTKSSPTLSVSVKSETSPRRRPKYLEIRHFVHAASHYLHNYNEGFKDWCDHGFLKRSVRNATVDIECGPLSSADSKNRGPPGHYLDGTASAPSDPDSQQSEPKEKGYSRTYRFFPDEPTISQWWKVSWLDLLTLLLCSLTALVIYTYVSPLPRRYFPIWNSNGTIANPRLAYPYRPEYITTFWSAIISFLVPFILIALIGTFLVGSYWDLDNALKGLGYALATATVFQVFIKILVGGLRPHWYAACDPSYSPVLPFSRANFMYDQRVCRGDRGRVNEAMSSFPSGHSSAAFAGFTFLALYINAKFKVFADHHSRHWKLLLFVLPILTALLMALSKVIDYWHNWYDVLVGSIIGTLFALMAYRMVYTSVWDWRTNHIPTRNILHTAPPEGVPPTRYYTAINQHDWHSNWAYFKPREHGTGHWKDPEPPKSIHEGHTPPEADGVNDRRPLDLNLVSMGSSLHVPSRSHSRSGEHGAPSGIQSRPGMSDIPIQHPNISLRTPIGGGGEKY
ncbi:hypothetical protein GQ43DRAFT_262919 [Delitschia confertaspora ATCC 74209]|uniref:Phosphatidic acid phosphatase type 2/haloperoxidase domain-containing protein n=1 Tax=Delitschia confertaspora ATCC 74209 TaxID=1513339 RepID=A0A9P4JUI7_9PLEO|nr:hypothetical protein GQ43DRAFT_262919 [Delitschia confertaspora ATCC 74209]